MKGPDEVRPLKASPKLPDDVLLLAFIYKNTSISSTLNERAMSEYYINEEITKKMSKFAV